MAEAFYMKRLAQACVVVVALACGGGLANAGSILDVPGGQFTSVHAIDGRLMVGSYLDLSSNTYHGFIFDTSTNIYTPLAAREADGISGRTIVGDGLNSTFGPPFVYNLESRAYTAFTQGAFLLGISGQSVVGSASVSSSFVYNLASRAYTQINVPGSTFTLAQGIDGHNVVGYFSTSPSPFSDHGFLYDGSQYTHLDVPGAVYTVASGINGQNIVGYFAGSIDINHKATHGLLFDGSKYIPFDVPGSISTQALGVDGQNIVGVYWDSHIPDAHQHGFVISIADVERGLTAADFAADTDASVGAFVRAIWSHAKPPLFQIRPHHPHQPPVPMTFAQQPASIGQTPEPASITLFGIGIVGLAWCGLRRRLGLDEFSRFRGGVDSRLPDTRSALLALSGVTP
jgi:hypothetical protein